MKFINKLFSGLFPILFAFLLVYGFLNLNVFAYSNEYNDKMVNKISKDYTKKFCNGIGFGLSKESAMNFANKENNLVFEKKKGVGSLDKKIIANKIAISVIDTCGYPLNLQGKKGINEFENDYISMNNDTLNEN